MNREHAERYYLAIQEAVNLAPSNEVVRFDELLNDACERIGRALRPKSMKAIRQYPGIYNDDRLADELIGRLLEKAHPVFDQLYECPKLIGLHKVLDAPVETPTQLADWLLKNAPPKKLAKWVLENTPSHGDREKLRVENKGQTSGYGMYNAISTGPVAS